jgi:hypothetical protein
LSNESRPHATLTPHGASRLPAVDVEAYNIELNDDEGFIGDRANKGLSTLLRGGNNASGQPFEAQVVGVDKMIYTWRHNPSRANTRRTPMSCHFPFPVAVGTPRAFNAFAMLYSDVTPAARSSAMMGASSAACRSALSFLLPRRAPGLASGSLSSVGMAVPYSAWAARWRVRGGMAIAPRPK